MPSQIARAPSSPRVPCSRRRFIAACGGSLAALGTMGAVAQAATAARDVALHNMHTGEIVRTVYFADGRYLQSGLRTIDHVLRDWRTGEIVAMDPKVVDILYLLQRELDPDGPLEVVCGYRSPATNTMLRRRSRAVARHSLHMRGMAVDFRLPNQPIRVVHEAAVSLKAGGVGYYPRSGFIHVDCGPVRYWSQGAVS
jgi:uncharacterized protein YcbK (DUF882 family)